MHQSRLFQVFFSESIPRDVGRSPNNSESSARDVGRSEESQNLSTNMLFCRCVVPEFHAVLEVFSGNVMGSLEGNTHVAVYVPVAPQPHPAFDCQSFFLPSIGGRKTENGVK